MTSQPTFFGRLKDKIANNKIASYIMIGSTALLGMLTLIDSIWKITPIFSSNINIESRKLAISQYSTATEAIGQCLVSYSRTVKHQLDSLILTGMDSKTANNELINNLYIEIRQKGNLATTYASIETEFPDMRIEGFSVKEFRKQNETIFQSFCDLVYESYQRGEAVPYQNPRVRKALENYIDRRILLKELCLKEL